ncbi:hypothetical protein L208DRAFT_1374804 [Tricholoma matsutake]|nr:hypothetical protein L208DRAFT_1374804 [Tricholoma matsutake 945]
MPAIAQVPAPNAHYVPHNIPEPCEDAHKLISSSACKQKSSVKGGASKKKYSSEDLVTIAHAVVEEMPFLAAHGEKARTWAKVSNNLCENGFHHSMNTDLVHHKAEALVHYKKNPASTDEKVQAVADLLKGFTDAITIVALLERMESHEVQEASDGKKSEIKKKHEADHIGSKTLHKASMQAFNCKCKHQP